MLSKLSVKLIISFSTLLFIGNVLPANAELKVVSKEDLGIDVSSIEQEDSFGSPDSVLITPLFLNTESFISDSDWYKGLFYYLTTRLNQGDLLFHYIVFKDGTVVEGNSKGEDQRFNVGNQNVSPVIIAYLAEEDSIDFSKKAKTSMSELLLSILNQNSIEPNIDNITAKNVELVAKENEAIRIRTNTIGGRWERSLSETIEKIANDYQPLGKEFNLLLEEVVLPNEEVKYGDNVVISIKIKNDSKHVLFQGTSSEPLVSKVDEDRSMFYQNGIWLSLSQAPIMQENSVIKPGESSTFQLRLAVPLWFGAQTERFQLINALGEVYPNSQFDIKINISNSDLDVVEILNTETGQLNVRAGASGYANIISRVTPGQRFVVLERSDSGWLKLDLGNNESGWVVRKYTKNI